MKKWKLSSSASDPAVRRWSFFYGIILTVITFALGAWPEAAFAAPPTTFRPDRILIKPKEGVSLSLLTNLNTRLGSRILKRFSRIGNLHVISLPQTVAVSNAIAFFRQSGLVKYAEPDYFVNALAEHLDVEVALGGRLYRQTFARGEPQTGLQDLGPIRNRRGTTVRFRPDPEISQVMSQLIGLPVQFLVTQAVSL